MSRIIAAIFLIAVVVVVVGAVAGVLNWSLALPVATGLVSAANLTIRFLTRDET